MPRTTDPKARASAAIRGPSPPRPDIRPVASFDVIIIGRGIAGAVLSETLLERGLRVRIFDVPKEGRATHVAGGLVNPIVLRRALPSWRASEMLAIAGAFYRELEQRYDERFWHPVNMAVLFPTAKEAGIWRLHTRDPLLGRLIEDGPEGDPTIEGLERPYGHGIVNRCARLDTVSFLDAHRERWTGTGALVEREVRGADVSWDGGSVRVCDDTAPLLVRCEGPFARAEGLSLVRGDMLTVRIPGLRLKSVAHRGIFLIPLGEDRYRVGSTFEWNDVWTGPTAEARRWLLDQVERMTGRKAEVEEHDAGVRPTSRDRRPILGRTAPQEALLNGLGSRGMLLAPWCAQHLAAHLLDGTPLDPEVDLARFA